MEKIHKIIIIMIILIVLLIISMFVINYIVVSKTKNRIIKREEALEKDADCILILGAGVWGKSPSPMLEDRLQEGINLYNEGKCKKLLMSGDHTKADYDEVNVMKKFAMDREVLSSDIFMDHAGVSTYDSIYRAKEIFGVKKLIIVTQEYHLYRALYIAKTLGLDAYGVKSNPREYAGQSMRNLREIIARDKDFFMCLIKPNPKFLGNKIPITGNGDETNDKQL